MPFTANDAAAIIFRIIMRTGMAQQDFDTLKRIWSHGAISTNRKIRIFESCVGSKFLYALHTAHLNKAEQRRIDGFQARCLRKILGVLPSFISRVPNRTVLEQAGTLRFSTQLQRQQLLFLADLARRPSGDALRDCVFMPGTCSPTVSTIAKRRGRPRSTWLQTVTDRAVSVAGGMATLTAMMQDTPAAKKAWEALVRRTVRDY